MSRSKFLWWFSIDSASGFNEPYKDNILAHYNLDRNILSQFGSFNCGTIKNNVNYVAGINNSYCAEFQGTNSYILVPRINALSFGNGANDVPVSFSMWLYPTNSSASRYILTKRTSSVSNIEYEIFRDTSGRINVVFFNNLGNSIYLYKRTDDSIPNNAKTLVTITYDGTGVHTGIKIYFDTTEKVTTNLSVGTYVSMNVGNSDMVIGGRSNALTGSNSFTGKIENFTIWNKVLTTEIETIYNSGNGLNIDYNFENQLYYTVQIAVHAQNGLNQFGSYGNFLYWSNDGGKNWIEKEEWGAQLSGGEPIAGKFIQFAHIFNTGELIFASGAKIWRSTDSLDSYSEITTIYKSDGTTAYVRHTPVNASYPGSYFNSLNYDKVHHDDDVLCWNNYGTQNLMGVAPAIVLWTNDKGATIRVIYEFGQNTLYRDNGTSTGGATGNLLGDAGNALTTKHGHAVTRKGAENTWYSAWGDATGSEVHWLQHDYDSGADDFTSSVIFQDRNANDIWKTGDFVYEDGLFYIGSDGNVDQGVWQASISDVLNDTATQIFDFPSGGTITMLIKKESYGEYIFSSSFDQKNRLFYTSGGGSVINYIEVTDISTAWFNRTSPLARGYYKLTFGGWIEAYEFTLFIKI